MNNGSKYSPNHNDWRSSLINFGKIILRIICAGLALLSGFWLLMASNMGPAYLPYIMDGALDFWIRMMLLGLGLGIWLITALWIIYIMLRYGQHFIKSYFIKRYLIKRRS